jgi:hypothetical protein
MTLSLALQSRWAMSPKALDRLATISRRGTAPLDLVYDCVTEEPATGLGSWTTPGFWHLAPIALAWRMDRSLQSNLLAVGKVSKVCPLDLHRGVCDG